MNDSSETSTTHADKVDVFTAAVRAVLNEIDFDGHLPIPMRISPTGTGVQLQVSEHEFPAWCAVLAGLDTKVVAEAHEYADLGLIDHVQATGTIDGHQVAVITVRKLDAKSAVA